MMFHFGIFSNTLLHRQSKKTKMENFSHYQKELKWPNAFAMVYFIWTGRSLSPIEISNSGPFSHCFVLFSQLKFSPKLIVFKILFNLARSSIFKWKPYSNISINVYKDGHKKMKWKSGKDYPKSVVITDFGISSSIRVSEYRRANGTAGWAPPEQWLSEFMMWWVFWILQRLFEKSVFFVHFKG